MFKSKSYAVNCPPRMKISQFFKFVFIRRRCPFVARSINIARCFWQRFRGKRNDFVYFKPVLERTVYATFIRWLVRHKKKIRTFSNRMILREQPPISAARYFTPNRWSLPVNFLQANSLSSLRHFTHSCRNVTQSLRSKSYGDASKLSLSSFFRLVNHDSLVRDNETV